MKKDRLIVQHARENNLKEISLEILHDNLTVVTGLSGSGKSSLAFDTVYAEGQRRYIETFSPYTRQFLDKVKKPNVDSVENVRPAVAIQQRTRITNSRSTVGTLTNINEHLKTLWTNLAAPHCPLCGSTLTAWSPEATVAKLAELCSAKPKSAFLIACRYPLLTGKNAARATSERLLLLGYNRAFNPESGRADLLEDLPAPPLCEGSYILPVLDRFSAASFSKKRLIDSIKQSLALNGKACVVIELAESASKQIQAQPSFHEFSTELKCPNDGSTLPSPTPGLFSFNHPVGACPDCHGFGKILAVDPQRVIPNPNLSLADGAIQCWATPATKHMRLKLQRFCAEQGISLSVPWRDLPQAQRDLLFSHRSRSFRGITPWFRSLERKLYRMPIRLFLARYRGQFICTTCQGSRLKPAALAFKIEAKTLPDIWNTPIADLLDWIIALRQKLKARKGFPRQLDDLARGLADRLGFLVRLGLGYLTLDRPARTLSGGETQRVNLAAALGSDLVSTHFVLDEPSVGLHSRDTKTLLAALRTLQQQGNSLLVVEHDPDCVAAADRIIELGPQAGNSGGEIVYNGPAENWGSDFFDALRPKSVQSGVPDFKAALAIKNATARNLKKISCRIPLNRLVCLTGVSGSGKSTLITEVLKRAYDEQINGLVPETADNHVSGFEALEQLLLVDQTPLAKSPRANIATYTGLWDTIRQRLAATEGAKLRGLSKSAFSFNVDGGRCPACKGAGHTREDMQFLSDVFLPCELCLGERFQPEVLEVRYRDKNVSEYLDLTVAEAAGFFSEDAALSKTVQILDRLGLGHLRLGQSLSELSGGEAQRLKLIPFVQQSEQKKTLLIFDEPTTGLHPRDIQRLLRLFEDLKFFGHSILCVEHNLQLVSAADWIIDLGPEGGEGGGRLLFEGPPAKLIQPAAALGSYTAAALAAYQTQFQARGAKSKGKLAAPAKKEKSACLTITGAREHNLKNISLSIPHDTLVAITGVSGSGKSTIAKDIIYAEGQRRYLDCLSPYARHFIKELKKPDVDALHNARPTICVYQHTFQPSRISTIGTMSEVYNYLRLLFAKLGVQHCPEHPEQIITGYSPSLIIDELLKLPAGSLRLLAPVIRSKKGKHTAVIERARAAEITELRVDGKFCSPAAALLSLSKTHSHSIDFVLARCNPRTIERTLLTEAVGQALTLGAGSLFASGAGFERTFSVERTCPVCKLGFLKPDPEDLAFHSKRGACPDCAGHGHTAKGVCSTCQGERLGPLGRNLRLGGKNIAECSALLPSELRRFMETLDLSGRAQAITLPVNRELLNRLANLEELGLGYLPLNRDCATLSGGELQRLRLAAALGAPLTGAMYIFDEPSAGLHPLDNRKVLAVLKKLRDSGNSVLMIEHDPESILASEHIVDVGPGGGRHGGEIIFNGPKEEFKSAASSVTVAWLEHPYIESAPSTANDVLRVYNGSANNIKELNCEIPLQRLVVVAGLSGAGKSSLVRDVIGATFAASQQADRATRGWHKGVTRLEATLDLNRLLFVDQQPIGINSRSTPASYLGIWDEIRKVFAQTIEAKTQGWTASFFSYNTGKGRCPECKGLGEITLEMNFLPDAKATCESCQGRRFTRDAELAVFLGFNISQVLKLTFEEARKVFANHRRLHQILTQACDLGLGYLTLGQGSVTLSGGECQRIKLIAELALRRKGQTLYVLDEPTTGLHKADVARLVKTLRALVQLGNSVIVIEHDIDFILSADHVIELGPGPAEAGGRIIYQGLPLGLLEAATPWGSMLRDRG